MIADGNPYVYSTIPIPGTQADIEAKRIIAIRAMEDWLNTANSTGLQQQMVSPEAEQQLVACPYPTQETGVNPVLEDDPFYGPSGAMVFPSSNNLEVAPSFSPVAQMPQESTQEYSLEETAAASCAYYQQLQRRNQIASLIDEQQQYLHSVAPLHDNDGQYFMNNTASAQAQQLFAQKFKSQTKTIIGKALEKNFGKNADPDVAFVLDVKRRCVDEPMSASEYSRSVLRQGVSCKKIVVAVMMYWKGQFPNRDILRWKSAVERARLQLNEAK